MDLGPHAAFIWAAYLSAAAVLAVLVLWLIVNGRVQKRRLANLEDRGLGRKREANP